MKALFRIFVNFALFMLLLIVLSGCPGGIGEEVYPIYTIIHVENKSDKVVCPVLSVGYPNLEIPVIPESDIPGNTAVLLAENESVIIHSYYSRTELFEKNDVLILFVYECPEDNYDGSLSEVVESCRLIMRYEFSKQQLRDLKWRVTVTRADIEKFSNHRENC